MRRTAVVYLRVSTAKQELSPEAQRQKAEQFAGYNDLDVPEGNVVVGQAVSGKIPFEKRECGRRAIELLTHADAIIFAKLSRAFRNAADAMTLVPRLLKEGKDVFFLDLGVNLRTPTGKMVMGMLAVQAEWEADIISERTIEALAIASKPVAEGGRGIKLGGAPYGFRRVSSTEFVPDSVEFQVLAEIRELGECRLPANEIARMLNKAGKVTRAGRPWRHTQVQRILARAI